MQSCLRPLVPHLSCRSGVVGQCRVSRGPHWALSSVNAMDWSHWTAGLTTRWVDSLESLDSWSNNGLLAVARPVRLLFQGMRVACR